MAKVKPEQQYLDLYRSFDCEFLQSWEEVWVSWLGSYSTHNVNMQMNNMDEQKKKKIHLGRSEPLIGRPR